MITFDPVEKLIILDENEVNLTAREIYSRWKDWVLLDHANVFEAFRVVGGDDLGGGSSAPTFYFLRTDYGWKIRLPEADVEMTIDGNLVPETPNGDMIEPPVGQFSPSVTINRSNVATTDLQTIWETVITENSAGTAGFVIKRLLELLEADEQFTDGSVRKLKAGTNEVLLEKDIIEDENTGNLTITDSN